MTDFFIPVHQNERQSESLTQRLAVKHFSLESCSSVFKSVGLHSYSPPVNTSDSQQMNGQRGDLGS